METVKWKPDTSHSEVLFKVRHLVSKVSGYFKDFTAAVETKGEDFETAIIHFSANANSISTNNDQRDAHLRGKDFLDTETFPQIIFRSDKLEKKDDNNFLLHGRLTIKNVEKPVVLNVEYGGLQKDPWGNYRAGFIVQGKINRKDFGINFNMVSEAGGILVGDEVAIECNVEFIKQVENETSSANKQKDLQAA
jgi:polyisoprenoid-binding protein YceI